MTGEENEKIWFERDGRAMDLPDRVDFNDSGSEETDPLRFESSSLLFPRKPYALIPAGGYAGVEGLDFLIHKEISNEAQCALLFESIVDAFRVAEQYKEATGKEAEPCPIEARGIEDRFWVKYYNADGQIFIAPIQQYWERMQ